MKINMFKTNIISLTRKTQSVHFNYLFGDILIVRIDYVKDLRVMLDSKLHFYRNVTYIVRH
jgi:hypothetical protein